MDVLGFCLRIYFIFIFETVTSYITVNCFVVFCFFFFFFVWALLRCRPFIFGFCDSDSQNVCNNFYLHSSVCNISFLSHYLHIPLPPFFIFSEVSMQSAWIWAYCLFVSLHFSSWCSLSWLNLCFHAWHLSRVCWSWSELTFWMLE